MTVQIIEIMRRSQQGITRPFICRGDDGLTYFVKGKGAGRHSLIAEWICGSLARRIGLPVAAFRIVEVPAALIRPDMAPELELHDLGAGPAFGSQHREVMELTSASIQEIPLQLQQDVLVFDWWIRNADRYLTEKGGNPNLFWNPHESELMVIDHNQAFDPKFNSKDFLSLHVFARQKTQVFGDIICRHDYNLKLEAALSSWQQIVGAIPDEWHFSDPEMTVPAELTPDMAYRTLTRYESDEFWSTT